MGLVRGVPGFTETVQHGAGGGRYAAAMTDQSDRFVPFSVRNGLREPFGVTVGFPGYIEGPVIDLVDSMFDKVSDPDGLARDAFLCLRPDDAFDTGIEGLREILYTDDDIRVDVLDYLVNTVPSLGADLEQLLGKVNHELRVDLNNKRLVQRVDDVEWAVYEQACSPGDLAAELIQKAWLAVFGRPDDLDPAAGWGYATKAVEEVLKPIVSPNDSSATFGKMAAALRDGPTKWECDLPGDSKLGMDGLGQFRAALAIVGYAPGRHGGDGREGPTQVTARAVVLQAAVILAWIADGVLVRV